MLIVITPACWQNRAAAEERFVRVIQIRITRKTPDATSTSELIMGSEFPFTGLARRAPDENMNRRVKYTKLSERSWPCQFVSGRFSYNIC